jgi:hypothetical protein
MKRLEEKEKSIPKVSNNGPEIYPYQIDKNMNYTLTEQEKFDNYKESQMFK